MTVGGMGFIPERILMMIHLASTISLPEPVYSIQLYGTYIHMYIPQDPNVNTLYSPKLYVNNIIPEGRGTQFFCSRTTLPHPSDTLQQLSDCTEKPNLITAATAATTAAATAAAAATTAAAVATAIVMGTPSYSATQPVWCVLLQQPPPSPPPVADATPAWALALMSKVTELETQLEVARKFPALSHDGNASGALMGADMANSMMDIDKRLQATEGGADVSAGHGGAGRCECRPRRGGQM